MTIDDAIKRLHDLKEEWGGTEQLYLSDDRMKTVRPLEHIDLVPETGHMIVGFGVNPKNYNDTYINGGFWD